MITKECHVADVVTDIPKSADIFRKYGIDFCCGGDVSIDQAVSNNKKVDLETLLNQLNSIPVDQPNGLLLSAGEIYHGNSILYICQLIE